MLVMQGQARQRMTIMRNMQKAAEKAKKRSMPRVKKPREQQPVTEAANTSASQLRQMRYGIYTPGVTKDTTINFQELLETNAV